MFEEQNRPTDPTAAPTWVATGDFNLDGFPDFAVTSAPTSRVYTFYGEDHHLFGSGYAFIVTNPNQVETGYINNDNMLDLVVGIRDQAVLKVFLNRDGNPPFGWNAQPITVYIAAPSHNFATGDLDGDGFTDLAVHSCTTDETPVCSLKTYKGDGTGKFAPWKTLIPAGTNAIPSTPRSVLIADLNRDGIADVEIATIYGFLWYQGNGDGTFRPHMGRTGVSSGPITSGNFNYDDRLDIAQAAVHRADTLLNDGLGTFKLQSSNATNGSFIAIADLLGRGIDDLLIVDPDPAGSGLQYLLNQGNGTFSSPQTLSNVTSGGAVPVVRDMDLDGRDDIVLARPGTEFVKLLFDKTAYAPCLPSRMAGMPVQINVCNPIMNAIVPVTFRVRAAVNAAADMQRIEIWLDGTKVKQVMSSRCNVAITAPAGKHHLEVVAIDKFNKKATWSSDITSH